MSDHARWPAPHRTAPFVGDVVVPGSKSLTNRALILAAIGDGPSVVRRPVESRDSILMAAALTALGAQVHRDGDQWSITPIPRDRGDRRSVSVDCGLAGTVMRFVPMLAAVGHDDVAFDGDPHARVRPMATTIDTLRRLGVAVDDDGRAALPFVVHGRGHVDGGVLDIDASASSQFVSALLLAAPRFDDGIDLGHVGGPLPSMPHIDMTVAQLRLRHVDVETADGPRWRVRPGPVKALDVDIEPDLSNAGVFVAAALVTGGTVRVRSWPEVTDQAGDAWRTIAVAFGGSAERHGDDMIFSAGTALHGVELDLHDVGELTPVVAAIAALADGPSRLTGVAHLRGHETDRLAALVTEINRLGGDAVELEDGLEIRPRPLSGATFNTYADHRMAQAAVVLGLRVPDLLVEDIDTTAKTFPDFAATWAQAMA